MCFVSLLVEKGRGGGGGKKNKKKTKKKKMCAKKFKNLIKEKIKKFFL